MRVSGSVPFPRVCPSVSDGQKGVSVSTSQERIIGVPLLTTSMIIVTGIRLTVTVITRPVIVTLVVIDDDSNRGYYGRE